MQLRRRLEFRLIVGLALAVGTLACGPSRSASAFELRPEKPSILVGERLTLEALPMEDLAGEIEWEIVETYGGGLIQTKGPRMTYLAPPSAGTFHVRLKAPKPGGGFWKQEVPIQVLPLLKIEPPHPSLAPGGTLQFQVRQKGLPRGTFAWSLDDPEGGTVHADGSYQAPAARGTYRLTATSTEDKSVSVSVTVTVQ